MNANQVESRPALHSDGGDGKTEEDTSATRANGALEAVEAAIESGEPGEAIFSSPKTLGLLGQVFYNDPATWARVRERLKGKVNLSNLERAVKAAETKRCGRTVTGIEQIMERGGTYWKKRFTLDGPKVEPLSNFVITVQERLLLPGGDEVLGAQIRFASGEQRQRDLPHDVLLRKDELLIRIGTSKAAWFGSDSEIQLLRAHLLRQKVPERRAVETMGRHRCEGNDYIVLPGLVLDRHGPVEDAPIRLVDIRGNPIGEQLTNGGLRPLKSPSAEEHRAAADALYRLLPQLNNARIIAPSIAWALALPWAGLIRKDPRWGGFPHLNYFGGTGCGKTSMSRLLMRWLGFPAGYEPLNLPQTRFARLRAYSGSNLLPACFDEYRRPAMGKYECARFHGELRQAYGGGYEERGRADQSAVSYKLVSPIILAGEDKPGDLAILNRSICLNPRKDERNRKAFLEASLAPLEAFPLPYWSWCLGQEGWKEELEGSRKAVSHLLEADGLHDVDSRVLNNLAILHFGWGMFEAYGRSLGIQPARLIGGSFNDALLTVARLVMPTDRDRDSLDGLMKVLWTMVGAGHLQFGLHYTFKGSLLVIPLSEVIPEARKYVRETEYGEDILAEDTYRGLIDEALAGDTYIRESSVRADFERPQLEVRNQRRGVLIDPLKLEDQLDLPAGQWGTPEKKAKAGQAASSDGRDPNA